MRDKTFLVNGKVCYRIDLGSFFPSAQLYDITKRVFGKDTYCSVHKTKGKNPFENPRFLYIPVEEAKNLKDFHSLDTAAASVILSNIKYFPNLKTIQIGEPGSSTLDPTDLSFVKNSTRGATKHPDKDTTVRLLKNCEHLSIPPQIEELRIINQPFLKSIRFRGFSPELRSLQIANCTNFEGIKKNNIDRLNNLSSVYIPTFQRCFSNNTSDKISEGCTIEDIFRKLNDNSDNINKKYFFSCHPHFITDNEEFLGVLSYKDKIEKQAIVFTEFNSRGLHVNSITVDDIKEFNRKVKDLLEEITTKDMTQEELATIIPVMLRKDIKYEASPGMSHSPLGALKGKACCEGMSHLAVFALRKAGVDAYEAAVFGVERGEEIPLFQEKRVSNHAIVACNLKNGDSIDTYYTDITAINDFSAQSVGRRAFLNGRSYLDGESLFENQIASTYTIVPSSFTPDSISDKIEDKEIRKRNKEKNIDVISSFSKAFSKLLTKDEKARSALENRTKQLLNDKDLNLTFKEAVQKGELLDVRDITQILDEELTKESFYGDRLFNQFMNKHSEDIFKRMMAPDKNIDDDFELS